MDSATRNNLIRSIIFGIVVLVAIPVSGDDKEGFDFFEKKIRPVLVDKCYDCHSAKSKPLRAGLRLDTREATRRGGDSGAAVVPDDIDSSLLITALQYIEDDLQMPPDGKLDDDVLADFETWIEMGAPDPRDEPKASRATPKNKTKKLWAFEPLSKPKVPATPKSKWPITDLDHFIAQLAQQNKQTIADDADRRTLLRRTTFALTGLPPNPKQIERFLRDKSKTAFVDLVDELLDSPQFGERWGRHWLDVARFSESTGGGRSRLLNDAWRYRDYVISSFNNDKPFDQFIREQIAGDLLPYDSDQQLAEQLTATGFLTLGPSNYELQDKELLRMEVVDEQIDTIGRAFLGMTIGCARCHDHKFDPIPTKDYYALAGIFRSTKTVTPGNVSGFVTRPLPVPPEQKKAQDAHQAQVAALQKRVRMLRQQLKKTRKPKLPGIVIDNSSPNAVSSGKWTPSTSVEGYFGDNYIHDGGRPKNQSVIYSTNVAAGEYEVFVSHTSGTNRSPAVPIVITSITGRKTVTIDQRKPPSMLGTWQPLGTFTFSDAQPCVVDIQTKGTTGVVIADAIWIVKPDEVQPLEQSKSQQVNSRQKELAKKLKSLETQLAALKKNGPARAVVMSVHEEEKIDDWHIHIRGGIRSLGEKVPRGFLSAVEWKKPAAIPKTTSGRLELANWIGDPKNPLTARVIVNRIARHLGLYLVNTPDNFGSMGDAPHSVEILDWLTQKFIEDGWSVKQLVRRIVRSHYFRLEGVRTAGDSQFAFPRQRLDAECIRDAMMTVTGELDQTIGGPNIAAGTKSEYGYKFGSLRRSVYLPVFRNATPPLLSVFDFPNANLVNGKRNVSTLPTQALFLMNSPFVIERSRKAAERLLSEAGERSSTEQIDFAFEWALGRPPTDDERVLSLGFVGEASDLESLSGLFQSLFSSLDFRYAD